MATAADYSIVTDGWVLQKNQDTINFNVPSNIDTSSRSILGFMLHVENLDSLTMTLRLNGTSVWNWNYADGKRFQYFQEVVTAGILKAGNNVFKFESSTDDFHLVEVSDVVVWWRAKI
jgi:hypothetical protein